MPKIYLVVDGGATKTVVSLRNEHNHLIREAKGAGSNFQVIGLSRFTEVISGLLLETIKDQPLAEIDVVLFALAGIDSEEDHSVVRRSIVNLLAGFNVAYKVLLVENDAYSTLLGLTKNKPGVLVISGTGSIAYAHDGKGKTSRAGGWGHRSGDEGSGYWIGREILKAIYKMEDGRSPKTVLQDMVYNHLNITSIDELSKWHYGEKYSVDQVAKLSCLLPEAFQLRDEVASVIFDRASKELFTLAEAVICSAAIDTAACSIYFNGGTVRHFPDLFEEVKQKIEKKYPASYVELCNTPPIEAIFLRAKGLSNA